MLKNLFKNAKKLQNQSLLNAVVAGCMLIAAADGTIEKEERDKIDKLLTSNPQLSAFKASDIRQIMKAYENQLDADFDTAKRRLFLDIEKVADNSGDAEEVFLNVLAIAKADSEIEPAELDVIKQLAKALGQSVEGIG